MLPLTAVVRTSLSSQQSSLQTLPSVEAPVSSQFIDIANNINNVASPNINKVPSPNIFVTRQVPQNNNNNKNYHVNNYIDLNEFHWNSNGRGPREFHFTGTSGVKNINDDTSCPLSVLKTFLTDDLISNVVKFTNAYVAIMKQSQVGKEKLNKTDRSMFKL